MCIRDRRRATPHGAGWRVTGCSAEAIGRLLPEAECTAFQHRCRCKVKTCLLYTSPSPRD
eukprot:10721289-Alexandrium_andersonii.AAC.1